MASRTTSRHQTLALTTVIISPRKNRVSPLAKLCICLVRPKTIKKADYLISHHLLSRTKNKNKKYPISLKIHHLRKLIIKKNIMLTAIKIKLISKLYLMEPFTHPHHAEKTQ